MNEYISREAVLKAFKLKVKNPKKDYQRGMQDAIDCLIPEVIADIPSADVKPVKRGRWIAEYDCGYITPHCSECGETALTKEETSYDYVYSSYCPRCGAKLDKTE